MEQGQLNLSEHEASPELTSGGGAGYNPSDEERKSIKLAMQTFEKAKRARKQYDEKWLDNYKMFRGKQWKEQRPTYRHSEVINMIFQSIQSTVPIMTDSRPKVEFLPREPSDMELADILNQVFESDWESGNWLMQLTEQIYDAHLYGVGFNEIGFNPDADFGAGAMTWASTDPFHVYPDPNARDINEDRTRNFTVAEPIDVAVLKREYPEMAKYIKADLSDLVSNQKTELDQLRFRSPVDARTLVEGNETVNQATRDQALKVTVYLKDDAEIEERKPELGSDGNQVMDPVSGQPQFSYERRLKYPNGRKIVVAGGVLCEDGPNPWDDGKFPFARLVNYMLPREFWGISEIEQLESPQKIFNKLVSFALDVLTLMGNPIWKVGTGAGVDTDNLFNRPGLIVEAEDITQVQREEGVQLQPYVFELIDRMRNWFDGISGANDVTRGVQPTGVTAASAISELQDAAQTRIRLKTRNLDACLRDSGSLYLSRVFQCYSAPRVFRITRNENAQLYFKMHVDPLPDGSKKVSVSQAVQDQGSGALSWSDTKEYLTRAQFDVRVMTGSALPFAKTQKVNLATMLFDRGAIDTLELLKASDYPNYEAVYQRVQQQKLQDAQQQMAMQAQAKTAGPVGPPPQHG